MPDTPWIWAARTIAATGQPDADLSRFFAAIATPSARVERLTATAAVDGEAGLPHIVRLWARDEVVRLMAANATGNRDAALTLATTLNLVTPISGAVVLETKQQYDDAGLTPKPAGLPTVPTVPEPHEWALLLLATAMFGWMLNRNRAGCGRLP